MEGVAMNENVREKIHGIMMVAMSFKDRHPHIRDSVMGEYAEGLTEDVMDIMREAVLSAEAVEEVAKRGGGYTDNGWDDLLSHHKSRQIQDARGAVELVIAAAGFAEKEQGE